MIKMYSDAATKPHSNMTGLGVLIIVNHQQIQLSKHAVENDNHLGEFLAAQMGFKYLKQHYPQNETILYYTDSRTLSDAVGKNHSKKYAPQLAELLKMMTPFSTVVTQWIPEAQNHGAHHLANQALHQMES